MQQAYEASLRVKGAKLFNIMPAELRMNCVMVDTFKLRLDAWLRSVPDQPTIPGRQRATITNSLLDQVPLLDNFIYDISFLTLVKFKVDS